MREVVIVYWDTSHALWFMSLHYATFSTLASVWSPVFASCVFCRVRDVLDRKNVGVLTVFPTKRLNC